MSSLCSHGPGGKHNQFRCETTRDQYGFIPLGRTEGPIARLTWKVRNKAGWRIKKAQTQLTGEWERRRKWRGEGDGDEMRRGRGQGVNREETRWEEKRGKKERKTGRQTLRWDTLIDEKGKEVSSERKRNWSTFSTCSDQTLEKKGNIYSGRK